MNLSKLFETQKLLDNRIVDEHNLHGQDLLPKKILSLQVELAELAQELPEVFKFWSNKKNNYEKALVEYCDCLHFILSIGNDLELNIALYTILPFKHKTILDQFSRTYYVIGDLEHDPSQRELILVLQHFIALGEMLGFPWSEIEQSYYTKNSINHTRQDNLY